MVDYDLNVFFVKDDIFIYSIYTISGLMPVCVWVNRLLTGFQETKIAELRSQFKSSLVALLRKALFCYQHGYAACNVIDIFY